MLQQRWSVPLVLVLVGACEVASDPPVDTDEPPVTYNYDAHPEPPAILRDVALIDDDAKFTQPYVPGHRTTMDGRVAVRVQGGPPGPPQLATMLSFSLFVPEKLEAPILAGPPGAQILAEPQPFDVVFPPALDPSVTRLGHHAVCDPTREYPVPGERPNPYVCGEGGAHDCYDLTIVSSTSPGLSTQMWGTPVTVEVANPKTPQARIVDVVLGEPVRGAVIPTSNEFTEPAITEDGRLLTGRLGRFPRGWTNPNTGETLYRPYDLAYAQLPEDAEPCDVTGWTTFHPMSHAPYDPRMVGTYGLAAYPFRDTEGNLIPDGEDLGGTYPWVDREGANVVMTAVHGRIAEQSTTKYPRRCVVPGCESLQENTDWDRGFMVAGLWTHGKFVHLDGLINNQDWAVGVTPSAHWMVDLYKHEGEPVPVRFGAGRFIDSVREAGGPYPVGYTHNANVLDSLQNLPNHHPNAAPITPRDVVWIMSSGVATAEIAFDDLLDPDAFIVSNMQASVTQLYDERGQSMAIPKHWNGQVRTLVAPIPIQVDYVLEPEQDEEIHLQNGATSLRWKVPPYGLVAAGEGRVEPVALGGVEGRGFWLNGESAIRYAVPAQERPLDVPLYVGVFVDPRTQAEEPRDLLTFPDGTNVRLAGHRAVQLRFEGELLHEVALPPSEGWVHLGWRVSPDRRTVSLLHNGYTLDRFTAARPLFGLPEGELVVGEVGDDERGVRGWIDDLVVLLHDVDPEVACNHARGTLVQVVDGAGPWRTVAEAYPAFAHAEVALAARLPEGTVAACFLDLTDDLAAHLRNLPAGTAGLRERIHFPEGPLRAGVPRPDSSGNPFCLSCHTPEGKGGLSVAALELRPGVLAEEDPRRQPLQPPRRVFGNVPAGWIPAARGPGGPSVAVQAPEGGLLVDPWVLPAPE